MHWVIQKGDHVLLHVAVVPGSKQNKFDGIHDDRLRIKIQAPPEKGKANKVLIKFIATFLGKPQHDIEVVKGAVSRKKSIMIYYCSTQTVNDKLSTIISS